MGMLRNALMGVTNDSECEYKNRIKLNRSCLKFQSKNPYFFSGNKISCCLKSHSQNFSFWHRNDLRNLPKPSVFVFALHLEYCRCRKRRLSQHQHRAYLSSDPKSNTNSWFSPQTNPCFSCRTSYERNSWEYSNSDAI